MVTTIVVAAATGRRFSRLRGLGARSGRRLRPEVLAGSAAGIHPDAAGARDRRQPGVGAPGAQERGRIGRRRGGGARIAQGRRRPDQRRERGPTMMA